MLTVFIMFGILASAAERERDLFNPARSRSRSRGLLTGGSASPGPVGLLASAAARSRSRSRGLLTGGSASPGPGSGLVSVLHYGPDRKCCSILRSKNETYIHMRGLADTCSNDPEGPCTYHSVTNLTNNIFSDLYCLADIENPTCCSNFNGALCQKFGKNSNTNIDPITGSCSDECKEIHDCNVDPDHTWCKCSTLSLKPYVDAPQNYTSSTAACIPDHIKTMSFTTKSWCNSVYTCMDAYYRFKHPWKANSPTYYLWGCTWNNKRWDHDFDRDCCPEFCNNDRCFNILNECFGYCVYQCRMAQDALNPVDCTALKENCN